MSENVQCNNKPRSSDDKRGNEGVAGPPGQPTWAYPPLSGH